MKTIGVICEYNPFHNGHAKQLSLLREQGAVVCLMSGNYVQRGEPAVLDKLARARAALACGADVVLELPLTYAIRSAEGFADGAVDLFTKLGCVDTLAFGCEETDEEKILATAKALLTPEFPGFLKIELAVGRSFPAARQRALERLGADAELLRAPNNILAVEYCKAIVRRGETITPLMMHREGSYHLSDDPENPSASFLRGREDWTGFVPEAALAAFRDAPRYSSAAGERAWLARLRAMSDEEFAALPYGGEGLWRKVAAACRTERTLEDVITAAKSKRYTRTRLMRLLLCAYLGISEQRLNEEAPYMRVLAVSERGQSLLREMKKLGMVPVVNPGALPPEPDYWRLEQRAAALFGLFCCGELGAPDAERRARIIRPQAE